MGNDDESQNMLKCSPSDSSLATTQIQPTAESTATDYFLSGVRLGLVIVSFTLLTILIGLDLQIPASSVIQITSQFNAVPYISWITNSSLIVETAFIPFFGKVLLIAPAKTVLLISVLIFEIGSLYSAISPNCSFYIFGRVLAGLGASGMWVGTITLVPRICDFRHRRMFIGILSMTVGICSVMGTVIAGGFSEGDKWRWCYYIYLPIGFLAIILILFQLPNLPSLTQHKRSPLDTWLKLDWLGTFLLLLGVFLLVTGLQWGGNTKAWYDPGVILTLTFGTLGLIIFIIWEFRQGSEAIVPLQMFTKRDIAGCLLISGFMSWARVIGSYYIPIVYQLRDRTDVKTLLDVLPSIFSIIAGIASRLIEAYTGYVWIWLFFPPLVATASYALLSVSSVQTSIAYLAAFQTLVGLASGAASENCTVRAQAEYAGDNKLITEVSSLITFVGIAFSAIGLATSATIFSAILHYQVNLLGPNLPASLHTSILQNIKSIPSLPSDFQQPVTQAYLISINQIFISGCILSFIAGVSALLIKRKTMSLKQLRTRNATKRNRFSALKKMLHAKYYDEILRSYKAEPYIPLYDRGSDSESSEVTVVYHDLRCKE